MYRAKLLAFVITHIDFDVSILADCFGKIEHKGAFFPFDKTSYYEQEMGKNLHRCVVSFEGLIDADDIILLKKKAIDFENSLKNAHGGRVLNIDIGYMDSDKIVLPSTKRGPFKLYSGGMWMDMILTYAKGDFKPTQWAFADFKENPYKRDLLLIREKYKRSIKCD